MRLKLSISPCPNDTFMFHALVHGLVDCEGLEFDVEYHDIEELNRAAMAAEADVSKISCAVLPALKRNYAMLDSGAALGRGNGPLLVKRKGFQGELKRVAVPGEYTTANALVSGLFPLIDERTPVLFSEIAEAVERGEFDGGVLIHEGRFVYERRNLELVADLGVEWERMTDLPLPLGGIVVRRELGDDVRGRVERTLRRSIEYAFANPSASRDYVKAHARELEDDVIDKHIALFVNEFSLSLGAQGRHAIAYLTGEEP
ncbi:MAG: 1,4-dihydroxy-6-naphthoate synthase [Alistipes sp.]|nr:1,4-dihydroxy-6-naphthoate synthase [Alistipes sp.]